MIKVYRTPMVQDVSGEEVAIDQLEDYLQAHSHGLRGRDHEPRRYRPTTAVDEKIHFAVTPRDPRYYLPISPPNVEGPIEEDLLRLLPPDLSLQPQQEFPGEGLQYQDDDTQYQPDYPPRYQPRFPEVERYPAQVLPLPGMAYPGRGIFSGRREDVLQDPRDSEGVGHEEVTNNEREESKRMMMEEIEDKIENEKFKNLLNEENDKVEDKVATSQPESVNYMHLHRTPSEAREASYAIQDARHQPHLSDVYFTALVAGCTAVAVCGVIGAGICWYRLNKSHRAAQDAEYPAYGVTGPNKDLSPSSGDRKLAQSAHMYHYQHQKQQMIALDKSSGGERHGSASDVDSEEEGEDNEYTVYECPGLAPTGEMEVKNPLFHDDPTPATPSMRKETEEAQKDEQKEEEEEDKKEEKEEEEKKQQDELKAK
ncbi:protein cab-1 isoform X2 [Procambarus clarkii]|uniref:protein cab-1 isoform X2 n=1 Tax=Procambarus clarkii TaxID=6728 RepID=UPI0037431C17